MEMLVVLFTIEHKVRFVFDCLLPWLTLVFWCGCSSKRVFTVTTSSASGSGFREWKPSNP